MGATEDLGRDGDDEDGGGAETRGQEGVGAAGTQASDPEAPRTGRVGADPEDDPEPAWWDAAG